MSLIDIWSVIAGSASIVSLLLVMSARFPKWHRFISPTGFVLGGLALGRISVIALPGTRGSIQETRLMGFSLILLIFLGVLLIIFLKTSKKVANWDTAFLFVIVIAIATPYLLNIYGEAFPDVPKEDYLLLADIKEERSDLAGTVNYLKKYQAMISDRQIIKQVEDKILSLQKSQIKTGNNNENHVIN